MRSHIPKKSAIAGTNASSDVETMSAEISRLIANQHPFAFVWHRRGEFVELVDAGLELGLGLTTNTADG